MLTLFSGIYVGSWHLAEQDFHHKRSRACWDAHVGMIAHATGNERSRLLHTSPTRTREKEK
jgi:hypothetical protein